jgi:hypothetical protein
VLTFPQVKFQPGEHLGDGYEAPMAFSCTFARGIERILGSSYIEIASSIKATNDYSSEACATVKIPILS